MKALAIIFYLLGGLSLFVAVIAISDGFFAAMFIIGGAISCFFVGALFDINAGVQSILSLMRKEDKRRREEIGR